MEWTERLLQEKIEAEVLREQGIEITVKNCKDRKPGYLDPRARLLSEVSEEELKEHPERFPELVRQNASYLFPDYGDLEAYVVKGIDVNRMRRMMGWSSMDRNPQVRTREIMAGEEGRVRVRVYEEEPEGTDRPCLIFFHGGGFIAGSLEVVENQCRQIAAGSGGVVISVDYRLAPEFPYPAGLRDCFSVVKWAWEESRKLGISRDKIAVAGDSAGGNLAAACALRDRDLGGTYIAAQAILYGTLSRQAIGENGWYEWSEDAYENAGGDEAVRRAVTGIGQANQMVNLLYLEREEQKFERYVSPLSEKDYSGLARALVITAEYDYLRVENELYAGRLAGAGVPVRCVRYGGMEHAFFDKFGLFPQSMDCCMEIAGLMRQL